MIGVCRCLASSAEHFAQRGIVNVIVTAFFGVFIVLYFIIPQINIHKTLVRIKRQWLDSLVIRIDQAFDLVAKEPTQANITCLRELFDLQRVINGKRAWSFGVSEVLTLIGTIIIPVAFYFLTPAIGNGCRQQGVSWWSRAGMGASAPSDSPDVQPQSESPSANKQPAEGDNAEGDSTEGQRREVPPSARPSAASAGIPLSIHSLPGTKLRVQRPPVCDEERLTFRPCDHSPTNRSPHAILL